MSLIRLMLLLVICSFITSYVQPSNFSEQNDLELLTDLKAFDVITLFSPYDKIDHAKLFKTMEGSFENIGKVEVTKESSMFKTLSQSHLSAPVCFFTIEKKHNQPEVTFEVATEIEVKTTHAKTVCSIWKKQFIAKASEDNQHDLETLVKQAIQAFAADYGKANVKQKEQPSFHVLEFKEL